MSDQEAADIQNLAADLYQSLVPQAELSSRSSFSLLASLTLIGFSLASVKPQSVQVLGFTIQADDWLTLAGPLAAVVLYAVILLILAWSVELRRHRYFVKPIQLKLRLTLSNLMQRNTEGMQANVDDALSATLRSHDNAQRISSKQEAEVDTLSQEGILLEIYTRKCEEDIDRCSNECEKEEMIRKWQDATAMHSAHRQKMRDLRDKHRNEAEHFSRQTGAQGDGVLDSSSKLERERTELIQLGRDALRSEVLSRTMMGLGLIVPLLIALISFCTLVYSAYQ